MYHTIKSLETSAILHKFKFYVNFICTNFTFISFSINFSFSKSCRIRNLEIIMDSKSKKYIGNRKIIDFMQLEYNI